MQRRMKCLAGALVQHDLFMWQNTIYRVVNINYEQHEDDISVQRIASFWSMGRGGGTFPTWVWCSNPDAERFKADCEVVVCNFSPPEEKKPPAPGMTREEREKRLALSSRADRIQHTCSNDIDGDPFTPQTD